MKQHTLSRSERRDLQTDTGEVAESIAADAYDYNAFLTADYYDAKRKDSESVIEVKSCLSELSSGAAGRFRLFKGQHDKLVRYDREESARYAFVLFTPDDRQAEMILKKPANVGRLIGSRGGWNQSGHESQGKQIKLPWGEFF